MEPSSPTSQSESGNTGRTARWRSLVVLLTGMSVIVVAFVISEGLARLTAMDLYLPKQGRLMVDLLAAVLAGIAFAVTRALLNRLRRPKNPVILAGALVTFAFAGVVLVLMIRIRSKCVIGFDPTTWYATEQNKLEMLKKKDSSYANKTVHVPDFVNMDQQKVLLPLSYPPELTKSLSDDGDPPGGALNDLMAHDTNYLFDVVEKGAPGQLSETATVLTMLDCAVLALGAIGFSCTSQFWLPNGSTSDPVVPGRLGSLQNQQLNAFISYRREGGADTARLIRAELQNRGIRTFLDVDDLGSHYFDDQLFKEIDKAPNFILILSAGALEGCKNPEDWMRREIEHACAADRNIIPVLKEGFRFPVVEELPGGLADLPRYQSVIYSHAYFDAAINKLVSYLQSRRLTK